MDSQQLVSQYNQRWKAHLRAFKVKTMIFALFLAFVVMTLGLAWNVKSIGYELVLLTFTAPVILVGLIAYDLMRSRDYTCPQCSVSLTHKNPFMAYKTLDSCPECKASFK